MHDHFRQQWQRWLQLRPDPARQIFAGRIVQSGDVIEIVVVELVVSGYQHRHRRLALAPGPPDPSDAVHVRLGRRWDVVVHDVGEHVDVEAAGHPIAARALGQAHDAERQQAAVVGIGAVSDEAEPTWTVPDLTGVRYAMFGLGDTFYEATYSQGSEHIDRRFTAQGALRVGEYGRHDASSWDLPSDVALEWLPGVLEAAGVPA